jgi:hypothetical protein
MGGMKVIALLPLAAALASADPKAKMVAPHSKSGFDLTADPTSRAWKKIKPIEGAVDPMGKPAASNRFQFRVQWTDAFLYILFTCPFDQLNLKPNPTQIEETNKLWEWDVVEVFIGADLDNIHQYKELQVSPQGEWVDLDIDRKAPKPEGGWKWNSGMQSRAKLDEAGKVWHAEMKVPFAALGGDKPRPGSEYRINVYRLAGKAPDRIQVMWTPTMVRSHHTPEQFGRLVLAK